MGKYDAGWVKSFYDEYAEKEWDRWDKSPAQQVKFHLHLHYLRQYLRADECILEVGAGAGRFTREIAKISKRIVVADISPVQLRLNKENAERFGFADAVGRRVECDMCDLKPHFSDAEFDAVVCYGGPLSYVFEQRAQALRELLRVTMPGGLIFLSVMSVWGAVHQFAIPGLLELDPEVNREIIASGDLTPDKAVSAHFCHMFRAAELRACLEQAGAVVEVLSASNCLSAVWEEELEAIRQQPAAWEHLLEMELEACRESGCLDMGTHIIAVCRKPG